MGSLPLGALFTLIAALLNISMGYLTVIPSWVTSTAALAFSILALLSFFFEYIKYFEFVDPFFKKKQSVNVVGALRKPGNITVNQLLILSGYHDSALETRGLAYWVMDSISPCRPFSLDS